MRRLGRKPQGAGLVRPLAGSEHAKRRLRLFLQTLSGGAQRWRRVRRTGNRGVAVLRPAGRMVTSVAGAVGATFAGASGEVRPPPTIEESQALGERMRELEARAAAVEVQSELARTLPHVIARLRPGKKRRIVRSARTDIMRRAWRRLRRGVPKDVSGPSS